MKYFSTLEEKFGIYLYNSNYAMDIFPLGMVRGFIYAQIITELCVSPQLIDKSCECASGIMAFIVCLCVHPGFLLL